MFGGGNRCPMLLNDVYIYVNELNQRCSSINIRETRTEAIANLLRMGGVYNDFFCKMTVQFFGFNFAHDLICND